MPILPSRWLLVPALALAAVPGPAMFRPGREWREGFNRFRPQGAAWLPGGHLFTLDPNGLCGACADAGAKACEHPDRTSLVHLQRLDPDAEGRPAWRAKWVGTSLPGGLTQLQAGPGTSLVLGDPTGPYLRLDLAWDGRDWRLANFQLLLNAIQRLALGLPPVGPESLAVTRDGSLVLGLDGGVALVPQAALARPSRQAVKWLIPLQAARKGDGPVGPLEVAVDSAGQVLVLDTAAREVCRMNPATGKRSPVLRARQWPEGFMPLALATRGRQAMVAGGFRHGPAVAGLVALTPAAGSGPYACEALDVLMVPGSPFAFAPEGDLAIFTSGSGILRLVAAAADSPAKKDQAALEAKAQAAFEELLAEAGAAPAPKAKARKATEPEAPAPAADPAEAEDEIPLDRLCAGVGLRLPAPAPAAEHKAKARPAKAVASPPVAAAGPGAGAAPTESWASRVGAKAGSPPAKAAPADSWASRVGTRAGSAPAKAPPATEVPPSRAAGPEAPRPPSPETPAQPQSAGAGLRRAPVPIPAAKTAAEAAAIARPGNPALAPRRLPTPRGVLAHLAEGAAEFAAGPGFDAWFKDWTQWLGEATPADRPGALDALASQGSWPAGLGRFALPPDALARAVRWMLGNARRGNHRHDLEAWRAAGATHTPRFEFGCYWEPGRDRFVLELEDLSEWADWIDADLGGDPVLAAALARTGGITGIRRVSRGQVRPAYGLAVTLGTDDCDLGGIRPAGAGYRLPFRQPRFPRETFRPVPFRPAPVETKAEPFGLRPMPALPPLKVYVPPTG